MTASQEDIARQREVALVDLVDRLLAGGVDVGLRALLTSVPTADELGMTLPPARGRPFT